MKYTLLITIFFCCFISRAQAQNHNVAVFGGGGAHGYASLYLAHKFYQHINMPFKEIFSEAFGLSCGSVPAALLMHGHWHNRELEEVRASIKQAFPHGAELFDREDKNNIRRRKFETTLQAFFGDLSFGANKGNKFIFIASSQKKPVFMCDSDVKLDDDSLRCCDGTKVIKGIMASSSFSSRLDFFGKHGLLYSLFKLEKSMLLPDGQLKTIVDGSHVTRKVGNRFVLDGVTPTPLVIDYLKKIPGRHNIVVFDNGGPSDQEFRASIKLDHHGMSTLVYEHSLIKIFIISIKVDYFGFNMLNTSSRYLSYLENQVTKALAGSASHVFNEAIKAVLHNKYENYSSKMSSKSKL